MKQKIRFAVLLLAGLSVITFSCQKENLQKTGTDDQKETGSLSLSQINDDVYDLEVELHGEKNQNGHIHFRQDPDPAKIVTLDTKVRHLLANHEYQLQRAVDVILDGDCTGTNWLTLGFGLTLQSIFTDDKGDGGEILWRDLSAIASGTKFDIHFRVIDAVSGEIVLESDCYQYTVR